MLQVYGIGIDLLDEVVLVVEYNIDVYGLIDCVVVVVISWFDGIEGIVDLIVFNLFYIVQDEMFDFVFEVLDYELYMVLIDGGDGFECYCDIFGSVFKYLDLNGCLIVEIGLI